MQGRQEPSAPGVFFWAEEIGRALDGYRGTIFDGMRSLFVIALAAAGCSFDPGGTLGGSETNADAAQTGASIDSGTPASFCPDDPNLLACFTFEGDTDDRSVYGNHATATGASFDTGADGQALRTDLSTEVTIPDDPSLRFPPDGMSYEAWIFPDSIPDSNRVGIVDQDGGPSIFIYAGGDVQCFAGGRRVGTGPGVVSAGAWAHVACTHSGTTTTIYVDGIPKLVDATGGAISAGTIGMSIAGNSPSGDPFEGRIDSLRAWGIARTQAQICQAAGCP